MIGTTVIGRTWIRTVVTISTARFGAAKGTGAGANELWIQAADGSFTDHAADYGVADIYGRGRSVTFIDVNHDPHPDLFVGNEYPRKDGQLSPNGLFINVGGTSFVEDVRAPINVELGARCAQAVDYDADGWQDLLVCGKRGRPLKLYRNDGGLGFVEVTAAIGIKGQAASAQLVDVDGDGDLDLVRLTRRSLRVLPLATSRFGAPSFTRALKAGMWLSVADVNGDSRLDLYVVTGCDATHMNVPDQLLVANEGGGFTDASIPQADSGCGDVAAPIDHDANGTTDLIVMNGHGKIDGVDVAGPVQLISFPA